MGQKGKSIMILNLESEEFTFNVSFRCMNDASGLCSNAIILETVRKKEDRFFKSGVVWIFRRF